jgi:hypothetical protein
MPSLFSSTGFQPAGNQRNPMKNGLASVKSYLYRLRMSKAAMSWKVENVYLALVEW